MSRAVYLVTAGAAILGSGVAATGGSPSASEPHADVATSTASSTTPGAENAGPVDIGEGRTLYLECAGEGSPIILLEAGDESGVEEWQPVFATLAAETRTCAYDRAGVGRSVEAAGCRGVDELLGDLESLLAAAELAGPYVLVGASGGGYLMAGFAARHPDEVAGLVLVETPKAITVSTLPPDVLEAISCDSPINIEHRDYVAVEHDVWDARAEIGDFPMTVISNDYGPDAPPGDEQTNVADQQGWLVLSPNSEQVVVTSGHDVVWSESALVTEEILAVLAVARGSGAAEATGSTIVGSWHRPQ
jgi:hypothetical protein